MLDRLHQVFAIEELRKRIIYTLGILLVFRIGSHIPVPGVNLEDVQAAFEGAFGAGLFQFINMFTGGALSRFSLFGLGVIPYINASIILSLLIPVFPKLKELQQQGREGRRKLTQYTRWGTVGLAFLQAYGMSFLAIRTGLAQPSAGFFLTSVISLTAGTIFLMWLGERITENGIGNGISVLIMSGIIARFPYQLYQVGINVVGGKVAPLWAVGLLLLFVVVIAGTVVVQQGQRKIPIQYAKRTVGRRVYGGHTAHLPIRVNQGGVIPIIFASAILTLPSSLGAWVPALGWLKTYFATGSGLYLILYVLLIFFFTYFYSSLVFDPNDLAKNLREAGGFIPGVRPGGPTAQYLTDVTGRLLLVGALFLAAIAVLPYLFQRVSGIDAFSLGGTSLLILVGVGIDTIMQIEAHLVMRQYESLVKGAAFLGRRS
ncbi:MAG TPA: preprotein translocase subunit SecY [Candidatus Acetothermia bacterium]|nr:preprotein translocase subunit SecY [Candidatus Acetothermia bacterium]